MDQHSISASPESIDDRMMLEFYSGKQCDAIAVRLQLAGQTGVVSDLSSVQTLWPHHPWPLATNYVHHIEISLFFPSW